MWRSIGALVASVVSGVVFVWWQRRCAQPLVALEIFRAPRFSRAALTSLAAFIAQGIAFISLPFLFQSVQSYSPLQAALLFTPWPLAIVVAGPLAGRFSDRINPALISSVGLSVFILGMLSVALLGPQASMLDIFWRTGLCGLGYGFFQAPNNLEMLDSVAREHSGVASGVLASARTFGQSVGAAVVALMLACLGGAAHAGMDILPVRTALWVGCALAVCAWVLSMSRLRVAAQAHALRVTRMR
ncbi:MFS transporter [Acidihalobacter ferrooxydans]|uniref:MFS transporter n=1 Tax=Acidihalobacter ferrooxydans TaxID=1765967 RepID=UPI0018DBD477|nr:MFS transporter [Acidihalobacter ferrooxydans]